MTDLTGKVAVVTGGAGGIGSAICEALAAAGALVVVGFNSSSKSAEDLVQRLALTGQGHFAMALRVTDSAAMTNAAHLIGERLGRCDILVNCAGTTRFVAHPDLNGLDDGLIDEILATNVRGPFASIRAFLPLLKQAGDAVVINISSIAAVTANGSNVMYCASKAAVDNMTRSLGRALAPDVRVISVSPGLVDTEFVQQLDTSWRNDQAAKTPLRRLAKTEEVAQTVLAAVSLMTFSTGCILPVDGGRPLL